MSRFLRVCLLFLLFANTIYALESKQKRKKHKRNLHQVVQSFARSRVYPLKISRSGRFLLTQYNEPFLMNADAGWKLLNRIRIDLAKRYILSRRNNLFNTIFIQLLPPEPNDRNAYLEAPFHRLGDFSMPNEKYFSYVDEILKYALQHQMLVGINPAWLGCCKNGWHEIMYNNGVENCRAYGQFLAERFKKFPNVFWIVGGERDPLRETAVLRALAEGIKAESPNQMITYLAASSHSSTDVFQNENWLDFVMIHTYFRGKQNAWTSEIPQVYESTIDEWKKKPSKPIILGESQFEDENVGSSKMIRRQAYWTLLSGGAGVGYGSSVCNFTGDWEKSLNLEGVLDMANFYKIISGLPWEFFKPLLSDDFILEGQAIYGSEDYITVAMLPNNRMSLMYLPSGKPIKVNLDKFKGTSLRAIWINPKNNKRWIGGYFKPKGIKELTPPTLKEDWLLLIGNIGKR